MKKRLLSLALCLALCLGLLPVGVLATEGGGIYVPPSTSTGGGGVYVETHPVTVISGETEKGYDSIIEAFNNVDDGGTIRLNNDVTLEASPEVSGKNITLNLNGYVLGSNSSLTVKSGAALTVTNADAENSKKPITVGLSLTLLVEKGGSFTCTDGKISSLGLLSAGEGDYNLKLSEGENHCTFGGFAQGDANATVGDLLKANQGMALYADDVGSDVQIARSTLINNGFTYFSFYVGPCSEHKMGEDGTCDYCGAQNVAKVTIGENVAYYTDLAEAIANSDGGTVTMLNNVTVPASIGTSSDFTLDLNGKTITGGSNVASIFLIYGNVVVCDNSNDKMGLVIGTSSSSGNGNFNLQDGKLTIKSGTFNSSDLTAAVYANTGELIIESGTFNGEVTSYAPTSISGGTFQYLYTNYAIADLLKDGYGFKKGGNWLSATELGNLSVRNVTVAEAPLNGITVTSDEDIYSYGETVTLKAEMSNASSSVSYQWYKLQSNTTSNSNSSVDSIDNSNSTTCVLTDLLPNFRDFLGYYRKYVYYCAATCDGYTTGRSVQFTVEKADLRKANVEVNCLTYNGSEQSPTVNVTLDGKTLTENTDYTVKVTPQTNAGSYQLTINGGGNYTGTKTVEWKILPKTIANPTIEVGSGGIYDKTAKTPSVVVKDDDAIIPNSEYTVSYENNTNAGTATVKITNKENGNYTVNCSSTFKIQKAPALTLKTINVTATAGVAKTITVPLTGLMPEDANISDYATGTMNDFGLVSGDSVEPHLTYNVTENSTEGTITATVIIKSQNYEDSTATVSLALTPKAIPVGAPTLSKSVLTYGDKLGDITLSGSMMDGEAAVEGTFSWVSPEDKPRTTEKYVAQWVFTPKDKNTYATVHGETNITVNKAAPTGKPEYTAITTSGKKLSDASLTQTETSFSVPGTVAWNLPADTEVTANTAYTWKFTPQDEQNYTDLTGTITLWHKSSSSGSSGSVTPGTKTDTVKNPDGSTTKTETKADGSKTETTTASSGGGSTGITVTKTDAKGNTTTEASAKLGDQDVKEAQKKGEAVIVPVKEIQAAKDANAATKIKIDVPNNANKTTVEIPVENVTSGTVAVIVHEDGTEELVKDSKPTEHGVQLELSGSTMVKIIDNSKTFDDTKDHWSRDEVNFVAARELFNGVGGNQFGVSEPMTRGMVNTVLARLAGVDTTPSQGQAWYEVGTDWAKKNGISDGTNPTAPVTREQLATLLYRYAGSPSVSGTLHAADAASVSDYAEDALLWANQNGIVNGVGSNTIAPKDNAQRAQVAAMLARYLQNQ